MLLRHLIERYFGTILVAACVLGFLLPLQHFPDHASSLALALLTYAACFKLQDGGFADIRWREIAAFYALRYLGLPLLLFAVAHLWVPEDALGVFLLALVPAAVSSPAFAHMFGGAVPPAFAIVMVSTLLAPFLIPLQFAWASDLALDISPMALFHTLVFCIFLPMLLYAVTHRYQRWNAWIYREGKVISILLVAFVIALVIAKQRSFILADPWVLWRPLVISVLCYAAFLLVASLFSRGRSQAVSVTYHVCSGFNNVALGVSLALVHFPPRIVLFVAVSEMVWSLLPIVMRRLLPRP